MSGISIREINANFKRLISIFKKENDPDYKATLDEEVSKSPKGSRSTFIVLDKRGLIVPLPKSIVLEDILEPSQIYINPKDTDLSTSQQSSIPAYIKVKLSYLPAKENEPESIETAEIQTRYDEGSELETLFKALCKFNSIALWKSIPEEQRREFMKQYKEEEHEHRKSLEKWFPTTAHEYHPIPIFEAFCEEIL